MLTILRASERTGERTNRLLNVLGLEHALGGSATVYVSSLQAGSEVVHRLAEDRDAFVYMIAGAASCEQEDLASGDAARVSNQHALTIRAWQTSELIVVDMPARQT
jgi:redox-sensitive bicupin YhaK (pirin superfamily)